MLPGSNTAVASTARTRRPTRGAAIPKSPRICSASHRNHSSAERRRLYTAAAFSRATPLCRARTEVSASEHPVAIWSNSVRSNADASATPRARTNAPDSRALPSQPSGKKEHNTSQSSSSSVTAALCLMDPKHNRTLDQKQSLSKRL